MITDEPESMCSGKVGDGRMSVSVKIDRPDERRLEEAFIGSAFRASMLCHLLFVDRTHDRARDPKDRHALFGELPQSSAAFPHDLSRGFHLNLETGFVWCKPEAAGGLSQIQRVPDVGAQDRKRLLRQDGPHGISDLGKFDLGDHRSIRNNVCCNIAYRHDRGKA
jgi:hypothetical protein